MKDLVFICCQPHDLYWCWQLEVLCTNFKKHGVADKLQVLIYYPDIRVQKARKQTQEPFNRAIWQKMEKFYPEVKFFYYMDSKLDIDLYPSIIRPRTLARHFDAYPELSQKTIFYHDCDIIFNRLPDFEALSEGPINWQSDTSGYLDYNYLRSKEEQGGIPKDEAIQILCDIGNITLDTIKAYTAKTGGAQYILKDIDGDFWRDVERMCMAIRRAFFWGSPGSINSRYFPNENAGFQSWCADMWAVNMALWARGKVTDVSAELDFSWATDTADTYHSKPVMHNAGVINNKSGLFYKGEWITHSPLRKPHSVRRDSGSYYYTLAIADVK